ncbi:hypothetical protein KOW79_005646 [Hemibagrus wyckioides]|uniref:Uncharacterized protein n=1 Tax=Hemibagrus wyckioides TaxID=337641 RepID=A0A9D3NZW3_9TELE|nr:hypothetical protein KOW79_005646 [Hemibagrus wyckioides]
MRLTIGRGFCREGAPTIESRQRFICADLFLDEFWERISDIHELRFSNEENPGKDGKINTTLYRYICPR